MKLLERITVEPGKCGGRPCLRGLRIRVTDILGMLAEGVAHEEILRDFLIFPTSNRMTSRRRSPMRPASPTTGAAAGVNFLIDAGSFPVCTTAPSKPQSFSPR